MLEDLKQFILVWQKRSDKYRVPFNIVEKQVSGAVGISSSESRLFLSFFLMIVFAIPVQHISKPIARYYYVLLVGLGFTIYLYSFQTILLFPPLTITYIVSRYYPRRAGLISFIVNFGYLLTSYEVLDSYANWRKGNIDVTAPLMVMVFKSIAFAWNCQDRKTKKNQLSEYMRAQSNFKFPTYLEFCCYMFNGGNNLVGPFNEFKDFQDMITQQGVWSQVALPKAMPSQYYCAAQKIVTGFAIIAFYGVLCSFLKSTDLNKDLFERSFMDKFYAITLLAVVLRMRYYVVWTLSEVSIIISGLGFNGWYKDGLSYDQYQQNQDQISQQQQQLFQQTEASNGVDGSKVNNSTNVVDSTNAGDQRIVPPQEADKLRGPSFKEIDMQGWQPKFDRYINSDFFEVELCENANLISRHWNKCTGIFLRYYVYDRVKPLRAKASFNATLATMMVSAIWHGIQPGYFIFFGGYTLQMQAGRNLYRLETKGILKPIANNPLFRILKTFLCISGLNLICPVFIVLSWEASYRYLKSIYFIPIASPIILIVLNNLSEMVAKRIRKSKKKDA